MEREWLASRLAAGRSIESIARDLGRHPSSVAYWVERHGLVSAHASKHAPKGGIARERLAELVAEGLSTRGIAARLGVSQATVKHWLRRHGLETARAVALRARREGRSDTGTDQLRTCQTHGTTRFVRGRDGYYRCAACRSVGVTRRRAELRRRVIEEAGGRCRSCGYDQPVALEFHHRDPAAKSFGLGGGGTVSLTRMREEAAKCVLLCSNCHALVEAGIMEVP
jgi:transposase-like protein